MDFMGYSVFAFIFAMGLLIGWHEYGHYLAARLCGVKVVKFALGFGKPIFAKKWGKDQTEWSLRWIPLGGFAMMLNEDDPNCHPIHPKDLPRAFNRQPLWKRSIIVAAGPVSNFLLAIILFAIVGLIGMKEPAPVLGQPAPHSVAAQVGTKAGDRIIKVESVSTMTWSETAQEMQDTWLKKTNASVTLLRDGRQIVVDVPRPAGKIDANTFSKIGFEVQAKPYSIQKVLTDSAAAKAGMQANDQIISVDGQNLLTSKSSMLLPSLLKHAYQNDRTISIVVERNKQLIELKVKPLMDAKLGRAALGVEFVQPEMAERRYTNIMQALNYGVHETIAGSKKTLSYIWGLVTAEVSLKTVGGMGTMAEMSGKTARAGINYFLHFLAWWSISLAVFNLLPIPFLDGGHLLYHGIEFILRRKPSEQFMSWSYRLGGLALLALMVLAHTNDAIRLLFN